MRRGMVEKVLKQEGPWVIP